MSDVVRTRAEMIERLGSALDDAWGGSTPENTEAYLREMGLVYVDPALVEAVREAKAIAESADSLTVGERFEEYRLARLALADSVLAQVKR